MPTAVRDHNETFAGFHVTGGGMFEVIHLAEDDESVRFDLGPGWYWVKRLPDGDFNGPYPTARGAYEAATGE